MKLKAQLTLSILADEERLDLCGEGCRFGILAFGPPTCTLFHVTLEVTDRKPRRCEKCLEHFNVQEGAKG